MNAINLRNYVRKYLLQHAMIYKKYRLTNNNVLHVIDSDFIIGEIIDSSDEEIEIFYNVFVNMDPERIYDYLEYMADLYIKTNS